jgi:ABC-type arginine transport system permease subunit
MKAGHMEEKMTMDYLSFVTSINPFIIGILLLVLLAGAYSTWVSH